MFAVLFAALLHATWNALIKSSADKLLDAIVLCVAAGLLTLPALLFLPVPARESWPMLAGSTAVHVVYFTLVVLAYRNADMSFMYPLMRGTAPLFTAILAVAVLGENIGFGGWLGVALLCVGVAALALDGWRAGNISARTWAIGLANATVIVAYTVIDGAGARAAGNAWSYAMWLFALIAVPMLGLGCVLRGRAMIALSLAAWGRGLVTGLCGVGTYAIALWAMTQAPIALVAALRETSVLFGVAIATLLLHEKFGRARWLAVALVVAGAAAMKIL